MSYHQKDGEINIIQWQEYYYSSGSSMRAHTQIHHWQCVKGILPVKESQQLHNPERMCWSSHAGYNLYTTISYRQCLSWKVPQSFCIRWDFAATDGM